MKAQDAQEMIQADSLVKQMLHLQSRALTILKTAEASGDLKTALGAIREARGNLELLVRLQMEHSASVRDGVADTGIVIQVIGESAKQLTERIITGERTEQPTLP